MALSPGKQFESDFSKSVPESCFLYRFKDSPASFADATNVKFTPSNICDYMMLDDNTKTLYLFELKSVKDKTIPLNNIRETQIKQLTKASEHNLIAGFIINFRERNNYTIFVDIETFNNMRKEINKKSFNIIDFTKYGCTVINNKKLKTTHRYDIEQFVKTIHL